MSPDDNENKGAEGVQNHIKEISNHPGSYSHKTEMRRSVYQRTFFSGASLNRLKPPTAFAPEMTVATRVRCTCLGNHGGPNAGVCSSKGVAADSQAIEVVNDSRRSSYYYSEEESTIEACEEKIQQKYSNRIYPWEIDVRLNSIRLTDSTNENHRDPEGEKREIFLEDTTTGSFKSEEDEDDVSTTNMSDFQSPPRSPFPGDTTSQSFSFGISPSENSPNHSPGRKSREENRHTNKSLGISRREMFRNSKKMAAAVAIENVSSDSETIFWNEFRSEQPNVVLNSTKTDSYDLSRLENLVASFDSEVVSASQTDYETFCEAVAFSDRKSRLEPMKAADEKPFLRERVDNKEMGSAAAAVVATASTKDLSPKHQCRVL